MLDRQQIVYRVETDAGRHFVLGDELDEFRKAHLVKGEPAVIIERGQFGSFTGSEGRTLGFVKFLPRSREHLERELELEPGALVEDPSLGGKWRTMQVTLSGTMHSNDFERVRRTIDDGVKNRAVNFIVVRIESNGGDPENPELFQNVADDLAALNTGEIRTVAYIPKEARGASVLVALSCDHMVVCPDTKFGGEGDFPLRPEVAARVKETIKQSLAPAKNRSWSLPAALVDPSLEVFRYTRQGERNILTDYFTAAEAAQKSKEDAQEWKQGEAIKRAGEPLQLSGKRAQELGLATHVVDDFSGLKEIYHLEEDPIEPKPNWAEQLVEALARPELAWLLLMIGFVAMYIEMHTPGVGVAGFISGMCFLVYFWGQFLNGTAEWLEVLLFLGGVMCVLLELFVLPGFGMFGFGGAVMILASLVLASQTFYLPSSEFEMAEFRDSLMAVGLGLAGCLAVGLVIRRYLPRAPLFARIVLQPPEGQGLATIQEREALIDLSVLVGRRGVTTTPLSPAGIARVDDEVIHVVSDGDFVPRGAEIIVVEASGNRAVVRLVDRA
jgi:membrane-bound ClpP family serine protease